MFQKPWWVISLCKWSQAYYLIINDQAGKTRYTNTETEHKRVNFCSKISNYNFLPRVYHKLGLITKKRKDHIASLLFSNTWNKLTYMLKTEIKLKTSFNTSFPCIVNGTPNTSPVLVTTKLFFITKGLPFFTSKNSSGTHTICMCIIMVLQRSVNAS